MTLRKPRIDKFGHVHPPRRGVPVRLLALAVVLLAGSLAVRQVLGTFVTSVEQYAPPVLPSIEANASTTPLAQRAVVLIISGLREDAAGDMPTLTQLRQQGAQAVVQTAWPSTSETTWATLLSGAIPELSGMIELQDSGGTSHPIAIDHLLRRARVTRHTTLLAGHERWQTLIPTAELTEVLLTPDETSEADASLVQQTMDRLAQTPPDLTVLQLSQVAAAGATSGGMSEDYQRAAQRADDLVRRVLSAIDLQNTVLLITSDHGLLDSGSYGGTEAAVAQVPLVMTGAGVQPGDYGLIDQIDVAPTLAALLGLPLPTESQGAVRFDMLNAEMSRQAEKAMTLAAQQIKLADAYLQAQNQGAVSDAPIETLDVAGTAWEIGNAQGTFDIARQSEQEARDEMTAGRWAKIAAARRGRLPVALGAGALFVVGVVLVLGKRTLWLLGAGLLAWLGPLSRADALAIMLNNPAFHWAPAVVGGGLALTAVVWARRSRDTAHWIAAPAVLVTGTLFALIRPGAFSPSAIHSPLTFLTTTIWHSALALIIGGAAAVVWVWPDDDPDRATRTSYWFVYLLVAGLLVEAAVGYWLLGLRLRGYLPAADLVAWHVISLMQTVGVAGLGILLPIPVLLALRLLHRRKTRPALGSPVDLPEAGQVRP